ncbi:MAG: hemerythrin domain-containing protein [Anaerolineae bacterium]|nr:hemerythrin domain-containing protein [Anaerolineae bacterium]
MTHDPYAGATPEQLRSPLVQELLAVHNMFRDELASIVEHVDALLVGGQALTGAETTARIQALIRAAARYTQYLHLHHTIETTTMFPTLAQRGLQTDVIDQLNAEHDEIAVLIDNFGDAIHHLATVDPAVMDSDLRRLGDALHAHLAYEETHVCPLLARISHWPPL